MCNIRCSLCDSVIKGNRLFVQKKDQDLCNSCIEAIECDAQDDRELDLDLQNVLNPRKVTKPVFYD